MMPRGFWIARGIVGVAGLGLHLCGLYAVVATFGGRVTLGLYGGCALAVTLHHAATRRSLPCSPWE